MKPLFVLLTVLSSFFAHTSFATETLSNDAAVRSFNQTFINAADVKWSVVSTMYRAEFNLNGQYASAYFNEDGTLMAVTRNISTFQLPITLQVELKKDYADYWVTELFEVSANGGTQYYVTLETATQKTVLKAYPGSQWSKYNKSRKI